MKALEILKNGISFMTMHKDLNPQSREYLESEISQYEEAIKELEAPKSCDGCSHEKQSSPLYIHCFGCNRMKTLIDKYHDKNTPCKE